MRYRLAVLVLVVLVAGCGRTITEPDVSRCVQTDSLRAVGLAGDTVTMATIHYCGKG
jgi:hypothetical protein